MGFLMGNFTFDLNPFQNISRYSLMSPTTDENTTESECNRIVFHSSCWVSRDDLNHPESLEHFKGGCVLGTQTHNDFVLHGLSSTEVKNLP